MHVVTLPKEITINMLSQELDPAILHIYIFYVELYSGVVLFSLIFRVRVRVRYRVRVRV